MTEDPEGRVEWVKRTDFAEIAEAIGIESDLVISATNRTYGLLVMWTRSALPEETIMGSVLVRDDDGIYRVAKTGPTGTTLGDWMAVIESGLRKRFGPRPRRRNAPGSSNG